MGNDPWVQQTIVNIDMLIQSFKPSLTQANFDSFVNIVASEVTLQLEKTVLKISFNRLGGLQFDKEVRSLSSFLTSLTIETLAEIEECTGVNKLTPVEVRSILRLRVD